MNKLRYILGPVFAIAIIAVVAVSLHGLRKPGTSTNSNKGLFAAKTSVTSVGSHDFGALSLSAGAGTGGVGGVGGPSGLNDTAASAPQSASNRATSASSNSAAPNTSMIAPAPNGKGGVGMMYPYFQYSFKYVGGPLKLTESKMDVLRHTTGANSGMQAADLLKQLNFGMVDISTFGNTSLEQFTLSQDQDFGYLFDVNLKQGTITINQNWSKWPNVGKGCVLPMGGLRPQVMCMPPPIQIGDMPADQDIIAIASNFLKDHNIPTADYGSAYVQNDWRIQYQTAQDKSQFYLPESVTVIFPQIINGKDVYEQGGTKSGLNVTINIRYRKVSAVYGLSTHQYQASAYDTETDANRIIQIAERGGNWGPVPYMGMGAAGVSSGSAASGVSASAVGVASPAGSTASGVGMGPVTIAPPVQNGSPNVMPIRVPPSNPVILKLGTPHLVYEQMWDNSNQGQFYVPALYFPIIDAPANYYTQAVLVPLVKEVLNPEPPIVPQIYDRLSPSPTTKPPVIKPIQPK